MELANLMASGLLRLSFWGYVIATLILTHVTIAGVTIYLHRHQSHHALTLHPGVSHFFRFWLWLTTGMRTLEWVAIHRKHHVKCETPEDPHSPQIRGIREVLWQGAELYRREAGNPETLARYGKGTPDDWIERYVYRHNTVGIALMLLVDVLLFGVAGITVWAVQMLWIPFLAAGVINGIGHYWGYRNYECPDAATNIVPWGILIGGEELHNNHHAFANSARLASKWWEFDIGWLYIRLFALLGLAQVKKIAPRLARGPARPTVDMDTLRVILANRFPVMAQYAKDVLLPVYREELKRATATSRDLLRWARKVLVREASLLAETDRQRLRALLSRSEALQAVYEYKQRLQDIWQRSAPDQANPLQALQQWCHEAETAGIAALREFATNLRGYTQRTAWCPKSLVPKTAFRLSEV